MWYNIFESNYYLFGKGNRTLRIYEEWFLFIFFSICWFSLQFVKFFADVANMVGMCIANILSTCWTLNVFILFHLCNCIRFFSAFKINNWNLKSKNLRKNVISVDFSYLQYRIQICSLNIFGNIEYFFIDLPLTIRWKHKNSSYVISVLARSTVRFSNRDEFFDSLKL